MSIISNPALEPTDYPDFRREVGSATASITPPDIRDNDLDLERGLQVKDGLYRIYNHIEETAAQNMGMSAQDAAVVSSTVGSITASIGVESALGDLPAFDTPMDRFIGTQLAMEGITLTIARVESKIAAATAAKTISTESAQSSTRGALSMRNKLLNLSTEAFDDAPLQSTPPLHSAVSPEAEITENVPFMPQTDDDRRRIASVVNVIDRMGTDGVSGPVGAIALSVFAGDPTISTEAFTLASLGKAVIGLVGKVIEYIRQFYSYAAQVIKGYIDSRRNDRVAAVTAVNNLTKAMGKQRDFSFDVQGAALGRLTLGPTLPAGPAEVIRGFAEFRKGVHEPLVAWFDEHVKNLVLLNKNLGKAVGGRNLLSADQSVFDELSKLPVPAAPRGWKATGEVATAQAPAWGNVSISVRLCSDLSGEGVLGLSSVDVRPLEIPDAQVENASLSALMVAEYGKASVGMVDLTLGLNGVYDQISALGRVIMAKYTASFAGANDPALDADQWQEIAKRNEVINQTVGYASYVMVTANAYLSYLYSTRDVISDLVAAATRQATEAEAAARVAK